ncbi:hypothetical protein FHU13_005043 [Methylobacterium sp. R2-1]|nr:hypothetical protein [Methylobacterium sp. R2-1]
MVNSLVAVFAVLAVLLLRVLLKLPLLPFRALHSLWRRRTASV